LEENKNEKTITMEYWKDDGWFVGKLKEIPVVFSQGETLDELIVNINVVYQLMLEDDDEQSSIEKQFLEIEVGVWNKKI
jgi:predicted RNase H-like HicB family nuclease